MEDASDRRTGVGPPQQAAAGDRAQAERADERIIEKVPLVAAGTTGAEARDRVQDEPAEGSGDRPTPYGSREEVLERVMEQQSHIEAVQGSTPAADPSQRGGFNKILHAWTLVGALLGAGVGALAGWLAVHYKDSSYPIIIALAAVGLVVGAVIVGAARVSAEDGRVQRRVDDEVAEVGTSSPGSGDETRERSAETAGTRSGG
jgi:F0F1-type ATP synthase assembly protein I